MWFVIEGWDSASYKHKLTATKILCIVIVEVELLNATPKMKTGEPKVFFKKM
jgi:hypothetical protein